MADASVHDTLANSGDESSPSFLMTHPPLGAASAAAASDPLSFPDSEAAATTDDSARTVRTSSNSPTGCGSGSGGGGSSGNEASISNTSGGSENKSNALKSSSSSTSPPTRPIGAAALAVAGTSSSSGPAKILDRDHHPAHHRGMHQSPARPAPIAGAAASMTGGSSDDAAEGNSSLPPLPLREAINATATCWSPSKALAPQDHTVAAGEQDEDHEDGPLLLSAVAQPSNSTLPTVSSSAQATTSAVDSGPRTAPTTHPVVAGLQSLENALAASSSTIATTTAGSSGRGSGKSRKSNGKPKPFVCDQCGIGFSRFQNLKSHMLTHQNVRPFPCEECGQAFSRLHDLKRHQRLHTGARPFTCSNCFRSFARLDALNRHRESNSCQNVNLPQSLRDVALAHAAMTGMVAPVPATNSLPAVQEDAHAAPLRKRGRPTRAQAAAALSPGAGSNQPAADHAKTGGGAAAAGSNNTSASPPGAANGNRSSTDSRPATSVSNSIVPSDSVSQQHARRGGRPGNCGQRNNQSSDSSDGPRPPALPLQHTGMGGAGSGPGMASRDGSPLDLLGHPYDAAPMSGVDVDLGLPPGRDLINAATESWRVQQRQYGGPPAMAPGPALQMWGSPPVNLYAGRAGGAAAAAAATASLSPMGQQMDLASPLFLASMGSAEAGRKRRRGTSTSPVVGGAPPDSQVAADKQQSRMGIGDGDEGGGGAGTESGTEMFDFGSTHWGERGGGREFGPAPLGASYHRNANGHQRQQQQQQHGRDRVTPPQATAVGMSSASGANQSGSNSSAHVKGSTRTGGPLPVPNSSLGHGHPYQVHQTQSVDATVAAGGGDTSAGGTPQPSAHGLHQQHHHPQQLHAGLEVMHRRLDMLMQDNLWLRSRIVDLEHQSQADRMRMMEQDDQIRALLVERNARRGGSQDLLTGADGGGGGGPSGSAGTSGHLLRAMTGPHARSSSFLPPPAHDRLYEPGPYGHSSSEHQYYAEDAYGYLPMASGSGGGPRWNPARGYSDLVDDVYRHGGQAPALPPPPASARHFARHSAAAYYQQHQPPTYPPHQEHPRYDPRDVAATIHQGHPQQLLQQYPRYDDVGMDEEMDFAAAVHVSKRRRVMSPTEADNGGGGGAAHQ